MENFIFLCSKTHTLTHEYHIRSFSGPHFAAFGLNTEICSANLCIQSECGKKRTKKNSNTDTFYAVKLISNALRGEFSPEAALLSTKAVSG